MLRAGTHLAAGAIAAALILAGAGGAVPSADPTGESAGRESASSRPADSGGATASHSEPNAVSGAEHPTATVCDQADRTVGGPATEAAESAPAKASEEP